MSAVRQRNGARTTYFSTRLLDTPSDFAISKCVMPSTRLIIGHLSAWSFLIAVALYALGGLEPPSLLTASIQVLTGLFPVRSGDLRNTASFVTRHADTRRRSVFVHRQSDRPGTRHAVDSAQLYARAHTLAHGVCSSRSRRLFRHILDAKG